MFELLINLFFPNKFIGLITVTVLAAKFSSRINYYVKYFVIMSTALVSMGISIPVIMFLKRDSRNAYFAAYCVSNVARLLGITYEVHGIENVQLDSGGIIMLNHQGCLDLVAIIEIYWVCRNVSPMMKKEIFYALPFGIAAYLCNGVFIDRKNRAAATKVLSNEASKIKQGTKLVVCPEGTRHGGETLLPFKKGTFHLAIDTQCPIQPVVVSRYDFLDHDKIIFNRGHTILNFLPEVSTVGLTKIDLNTLVDKVQNQMETEYQRLNFENRKNNNVTCNC